MPLCHATMPWICVSSHLFPCELCWYAMPQYQGHAWSHIRHAMALCCDAILWQHGHACSNASLDIALYWDSMDMHVHRWAGWLHFSTALCHMVMLVDTWSAQPCCVRGHAMESYHSGAGMHIQSWDMSLCCTFVPCSRGMVMLVHMPGIPQHPV